MLTFNCEITRELFIKEYYVKVVKMVIKMMMMMMTMFVIF